MTDQQIRQIMNKLSEQDANFEAYKIEREKLDQDRLTASYKVYDALQKSNRDFHVEINSINTKITPIVNLANSVQGFDKISVWILKFLLGIAALIGALYTILHFVKDLLKR